MEKKYLLPTLLLLLSYTTIIAQTSKGVWMLDGSLLTNTQVINGSSSTDVFINPEVAVSFSDNWMAGARLNINIRDKIARVGQGLFVRHTFIRAGRNEVFAQVDFYREVQRSLVPDGPNLRFNTFKTGPGAGLLHFFNPNVALEALVDYNVFSRIEINGNKQRGNGDLNVNFKIKYFFNSQLQNDSSLYVYTTQKGDWVAGGQIALGTNSAYDFRSPRNVLQPYVGYFVSDHILIACGLNYSDDTRQEQIILGLNPFARYYVKVGRKKQIFGELQGLYNLVWFPFSRNKKWEHWSRSGGASIGFSNGINRNVSFDIKVGLHQDGLYGSFLGNWLNYQRFSIGLGLQAFINKE